MSERSTPLLLRDIQSAIRRIFEFTAGFTEEQYLTDVKTRQAVERNFEIIGEACSRIPEAFKTENSSVPWRLMKDFRNFVIHRYFGIDDVVVWETIQTDLPPLLPQIDSLVVTNPASPDEQ